MSKTVIVACICLSIFAGMLASGDAQEPPLSLFQVVNSLKEQQTQLADNQNKIDEKLAGLDDAIREARIFMSRAGGKHKLPPPPKKP